MKTIRHICWIVTAILVAFIIFVLGVYIHAKNNEPEHIVESPNTGAYGVATGAMAIYLEPTDDIRFLGADVSFIELDDNDRYIIECVVAGEAGGHSYELMKAVAQCMAVSMDIEDMTADELRAAHQYNGWNPGLEYTDPVAWALVESAVSEIFDEGNFVTYSLIQYFYNPEHGSGDFHESMHYVMTIDGCRFFSQVVM